MILSDLSDAISAFQTSSGVAASDLSLVIRTFLLACAFAWGLWCVAGLIHQVRYHDVEFDLIISKVLKIAFILSLMVALVFVQ